MSRRAPTSAPNPRTTPASTVAADQTAMLSALVQRVPMRSVRIPAGIRQIR
jgi:hypothetical protein